MLVFPRTVSRAVVGAVGLGAVAGTMLFGVVPCALADPPPPPPPGCSAGDFEQVTATSLGGDLGLLLHTSRRQRILQQPQRSAQGSNR